MDMLNKLKILSAQMDDPNFVEALGRRFEKFLEARKLDFLVD